ncbi:MAG: hypothetical protein JWM95_4196 [Gemmatimonadetes bacterium]|nr:hypothetical protein [Gemmatimonadota bacterium]
MIIGHVGVAFATTRFARRTGIFWALFASLAPDIWRQALEDVKYGPWHANLYSHAYPWVVVLGIVLASTAWIVTREAALAIILALLVASHVALDMISGWKPLWIGGPSGLDLQHMEQAEFVLEACLAWLGWRLLPRTRVPRWLTNKATLFALIVVQGTYAISYYRARPSEIRCIMYPFAPCWTKL